MPKKFSYFSRFLMAASLTMWSAPRHPWGLRRSVVQKGQFTERFSRIVHLEQSRILVAFEHLGALQIATADDVEAVAFVTFLNHNFSLEDVLLIHSVDHDVLLTFFQSLEHEGDFYLVPDSLLSLTALFDYFGNPSLLLVVSAESLGRDRAAWTLGSFLSQVLWQDVYHVVFRVLV